MWHNLTLRARILLGYGLILILTLALFLVLRVDALSERSVCSRVSALRWPRRWSPAAPISIG